MEAIILAGGRGTRLSSIVPELPKPMAPVGDRPFLSYLLDLLVDQGVTSICISTGYRAELIEGYFGAGFRDIPILYARETSPLGTGGAIRAALSKTAAKDVFVLNGDTIAAIDLRSMYAQHESSGDRVSVALTQVSDAARYGAVIVSNGHIERFSEKGTSGSAYINAGVYVLRRDLFDAMSLPDVFSFERQVLMDRLTELRPGAFLSSGYFVDIGIPEDYARAQEELPSILSSPARRAGNPIKTH